MPTTCCDVSSPFYTIMIKRIESNLHMNSEKGKVGKQTFEEKNIITRSKDGALKNLMQLLKKVMKLI